jgi:hypothetical protein
MMFDEKPISEIYRSMEAEVAKALSELRCAQNDIAQAETRMKFALAIIHYLKNKDLKAQ